MSLLDLLIPAPRLVELDHVDLAAPPARVWERVRHGDLFVSPLVRALFTLRTLPDRLVGKESPIAAHLDDLTSSPEQPGFQILGDDPPHEVAVGAIGKVWQTEIPFVHVPNAVEFRAFTAPEFVKVAYGDVWTPIIPGIRLFCLYGALYLYVQPFHSICNGVGKPYLPLRWMLIYLPINLALIWAGVHFGQLNGAILVRSVMPVFVVLTLGRQVMRMVHVPWGVLVRATAPAVSACAVMAAVVLGVDRLAAAAHAGPPAHLAMASLSGAVTYGAMLVIFWRSEVKKLWEVVARR